MKVLASSKNELWCTYLTYVDKLPRDKNSLKYLLVRQDVFDRIADAKGLKKNQKNGACIFEPNYRKESTEINLGRQGNRICWKV